MACDATTKLNPSIYWRCDEPPGTDPIPDRAGADHPGTVTTAVLDGEKAIFNGTGGEGIECQHDFHPIVHSNQFTLSGWVQSTSTANDEQTILSWGKPGAYAWSFQIWQQTRLLIFFGNNLGGALKQAWTAPGSFAAGALIHAAVTYDQANIRLYVNGALSSTTAYTGAVTNPTEVGEGGTRVAAGGDWAGNRDFIGNMRKLAYFPQALSSDQIAEVYGYGAAAKPCRKVAPPCRLFPRDDGLGVGGGRIFPPPKSQQRSGRRFGYY